MTREIILGRLMRRYAAEGTVRSFDACARLLESAPTDNDRNKMLTALDQGLPAHVIPSETIPPALQKQLGALWKKDSNPLSLDLSNNPIIRPSNDPLVRSVPLLRVLARLGDEPARRRAVELAADKAAPSEFRVAMLGLLGELAQPSSANTLLGLIIRAEPESVQLAALGALQSIPNAEIRGLLANYPTMSGRVRNKTREALLSRKSWAHAFLEQVDSGNFPTSDVAVEELRKVALLQDSQLDELVRKHWGNITSGTPEEKLADVRRFNNDLRAFNGDSVRGREIYKKTCAICHRLYDEGNQVGPDLTHANRKDRDYLLVNIVDPSAVIRKEYLNYNLETTDGRFLTGLIAEQSADRVTILAANNERTTIARDQIKTLQESPVSLMPENLLNGLKPQELRDLFSYLQSDKP